MALSCSCAINVSSLFSSFTRCSYVMVVFSFPMLPTIDYFFPCCYACHHNQLCINYPPTHCPPSCTETLSLDAQVHCQRVVVTELHHLFAFFCHKLPTLSLAPKANPTRWPLLSKLGSPCEAKRPTWSCKLGEDNEMEWNWEPLERHLSAPFPKDTIHIPSILTRPTWMENFIIIWGSEVSCWQYLFHCIALGESNGSHTLNQ